MRLNHAAAPAIWLAEQSAQYSVKVHTVKFTAKLASLGPWQDAKETGKNATDSLTRYQCTLKPPLFESNAHNGNMQMTAQVGRQHAKEAHVMQTSDALINSAFLARPWMCSSRSPLSNTYQPCQLIQYAIQSYNIQNIICKKTGLCNNRLVQAAVHML